MAKTHFQVHMKHLKVMVNQTDDEILPVAAQFLWFLKFSFSSSHGKLFLVLFQATVFIL